MTVRHADRPRIALTAAIIHEDPERALFKGKALQFSEQKMAHAVWRGGGLPIQLLDLREKEALEQAIAGCDGLLLQGGADVAPVCYGEQPLRPEWGGDLIRDQHELAAIEVALALGKPILGICRGVQVLNVALGGSLYQDIETQVADSLVHRDWDRYEIIEHEVALERESWLGEAFRDHGRAGSSDGALTLLTNTIHHQSVNRVGISLAVSARAPDGVIEALEVIRADRWAVGVQWHPEWLDGSDEGGAHRTPGNPVFSRFAQVCRERAVGRT
ncbi:Para-aminobenzoate synthase, amidotransferase component [Enhygromyxa salina]|uniref:Para-aminobenzoate synthase, amidotransferase component n=1 Tax=Enhygromyxa salina TaxID=215803 RepID=A0A0C1ZNC8_9BACT|nr:gamma-glutamyl-gamma-aminobutyrate hydrolase family protein [Enhygromyxa salina]KIG12588.1 Para-aminobenzoate synthase, amidotransferase component [Enhygromyxa salina]